MIYIDRTSHCAPDTLDYAAPALPFHIADFEKEVYDMCGRHSNYVPAFTVIDDAIVFYADGPWEC